MRMTARATFAALALLFTSTTATAEDDFDKGKTVTLAVGNTSASGFDAYARMLARGVTKLRPQDWKSGDRLWVVEVIAPGACPGQRAGGGHDAMVADLKAKVPLKVLALVEGRKELRVV